MISSKSSIRFPLLFVSLLSFWSCQGNKVERAPVIAEDTTAHTVKQVVEIDSAYELLLERKAERINSFFTNRYKNGLFNGAVLFAEKGRIIYKNAFGYADFKNKDTLTIETPFQLASVSKPLTALAILMLKEKNYLSLEDSVQRFFPKFPYKGITVRMLLTHRSGLPNYMYFSDELWEDRKIPISNNDVLCLMETYRPNIYYIPNYRYNYCNTNFSLLASIVEQVTKMPFKKFMDQYIFTPLEMNNTTIYNKRNKETIENAAIGYTRTRRRAEDTYLNGVTGDKGVYSTVDDLFKLDQALYNENLLDQETLKEAFTPHHPELYDHDNYGLGWRINTRPDCQRIIFHSGWWKGFRTHFIRIPDKQQTVIVLANTDASKYVNTRQLIELIEYSGELNI